MSFELPRCTPESQGVKSALLAEVLEDLNQLPYVKGIIFLRHGAVIAENYRAPYRADVPNALWSLSKSFTSCAIGLARAEKRLEVEDKVIDFFPEYRACVTDKRMFDVTLQDLLTMRSGHDVCAFPYAHADTAGDWVRGFLSSPLVHDPGTFFAYNSLGTYMLSAVIRRVTGLNVREYLMPRLFEPLGITPGEWECCPAGTNCGGFGLYLKTMDIAKFSQLLLNKGRWNGVQLLPEDYLDEATLPHADNSMNELPDWKCGYGYQFWRSRHGFRGDGACGQYALMLPEEDMAVAVNGSMTEMGRVLDILWEKLLPQLHGAPLPEDPEGAALLEKVCASSGVPAAPAGEKALMKDYAFEFYPNAAGIEGGSIKFLPDKCILALKTPRGVEEIRAGFGRFEEFSAQLQDRRPHPLAGCASWKDENTLEITLLHLDGTFRDTWEIEFADGTLQFRWRTVCSLFRPLMMPLQVVSSRQI